MKKLFIIFLILIFALPCFATNYEILYCKDTVNNGCYKIITAKSIGYAWGIGEDNTACLGTITVDIDSTVYNRIINSLYFYQVTDPEGIPVVEIFVDLDNTHGSGRTDDEGQFIYE